MSLLRPSIAGRLLRAAGPTGLRSIPNGVRCKQTSSDKVLPPTPSSLTQPRHIDGESPLIDFPQSKDKMPKHNQPDYGVEVDQAAS